MKTIDMIESRNGGGGKTSSPCTIEAELQKVDKNCDKPPLVRRIASRGRNGDAKAAALQTRLTRATKQEGDRVSGGRFELEKTGGLEDRRSGWLQEQAAQLCHSEALAEESLYLSQMQTQVRTNKHLCEKFCNYFSSLRANVVSVAIQPLNGKNNNCPLTPNPSPVGRGENKYASLFKADCELRARTPFELTKCQVKWRGDAHGGVEAAEQSVDPLNASNQAGGGPLAVEGLKQCHSEPYYCQVSVSAKPLKVSGEESLSTLTEILRAKNNCHPQNDVAANEPLIPNFSHCEKELVPSTYGRGTEFQHDKGVLEIQGEGANNNQRLLSQSKLVKILLTYLPTSLLTPIKNLVPYYPGALVSSKEILPTPLYKGGKKAAFTLAEVLITLGIIGVVAAMTIPALTAKWQKVVLVNTIKSSYSIVANAFLMSIQDNGNPTEWDWGTDFSKENKIRIAETYLIPYLNIIQTDKTFNDSLYYIGRMKNGTTIGIALDGVSAPAEGQSLDPHAIYIRISTKKNNLQDSLQTLSNNDQDYSKTDFLLQFRKSSPKLTFFNWGGNTREGMKNTSKYACNKTNPPNKRLNCGALIFYDGWQIKDDYPW